MYTAYLKLSRKFFAFEKTLNLLVSLARGIYFSLYIYLGSNGPFPGKSTKATMNDIKSEYETLAKAIEKSDEIVIIGGGPVGVEMAGEIVDRYKDKKIHLIHSGNHLVTKEFGDTFQTNMRWCLDNANVEVILSIRIIFCRFGTRFFVKLIEIFILP